MIWLGTSVLSAALVCRASGGWRGMSRTRRRALAAVVAPAAVAFVVPWVWLDIVAMAVQLVAWAVFIVDDDDRWNGLRRRVKARLKRAASLAWGVPARRPQPA